MRSDRWLLTIIFYVWRVKEFGYKTLKMNINALKTWLIYVILFFDFYNKCETEYLKYFKRFVNYYKGNRKKYQIILILNTRMMNLYFGSIVYPSWSKLPGLMNNISQFDVKENFVELLVYDEPKTTTLFIYIENSK